MVVKITTRNNKQLQKALNWSETYCIQFYNCYLKDIILLEVEILIQCEEKEEKIILVHENTINIL